MMTVIRNTCTNPAVAMLASIAISVMPMSTPDMSGVYFGCPNLVSESSQTNTGFVSYHPQISSRGQAFSLFAKQEYYTPDELATYKTMLKKKSRKIGYNINDLFKKRAL